MILVLDNFDSFTYNIVQAIGGMGRRVEVRRNNEVTTGEILGLSPSALVISPGPGTPLETGVSLDAMRLLERRIPILGVCLGHQCIGHFYGGKVVRAAKVMHGKTSRVLHRGVGMFTGTSSPFDAMRYHSLIVSKEGLPDCLEITAWTAEGEIMGVRHKDLPVEGVQFHPDSVFTQYGERFFRNFLEQNGL